MWHSCDVVCVVWFAMVLVTWGVCRCEGGVTTCVPGRGCTAV